MIEMLGVLAIIGVLSVGGIAGYSKAMEKYRINKTLDQITQIITNTRVLFANQTAYIGFQSAKDMILPAEVGSYDSGSVESSLILKFSQFPRSWFSYLASNMAFSPRAAMLQIDIGNDKEACVALSSYDWKTALGESLVAIGVANAGQLSSLFYRSTIDSISYVESFSSDGSSVFAPATNLPLHMDKIAKVCQEDTIALGIIFK